MARTGDTPRARALGAELQHLRELAGLSTRQLAAQLGKNNVTITRWETGQYPPTAEDAARLLGTLGVTGAYYDELVEMARDADDPNWVLPGVDKQLSALIKFERTATLMVDVQPLLIPGLLQTSDYARSIMLAAGGSEGDADHRVQIRMGRREVLTRNRPVEFVAVIGEYALRYPPCDRLVMADQLAHLRSWSRMDNVTVQVLPAEQGWSPALDGPFLLLEFPRARPIVHLEHYRSSVSLFNKRDVADYQEAADTVRKAAMSPEDSVELIADIANTVETTE
ncbi:helix-turn-helix domain-containing protein [Haloechinothrix alba]|nr:helix-turn-helix transcriptional regulator [Haloechinothrix alba]